jgi:hypothetical protein
MAEVKDKHPAILVKDAILARSGIYVYGRGEMLSMGFALKDAKEFYGVFRPPEVLIGAKDKFAFAVVTKEHTVFDTSPENFRDQADGVVGDSIEVVPLDGGNIGLKGRVAFYTKDVADYFEQGNRETSAQYRMRLAQSSDPARDGYDFVMTDILSVNGLAITARGRGGSSVRVLDNLPALTKAFGGSSKMKSGFLSFLGIGKTKDTGFRFSDILFGGIARVKTLDAAGIEKEVGEVMSHVAALGDSEAKEFLTGAVADCFKNAEAVLSRRDEVAKRVDELYGKCRDDDAEAVKRILEGTAKAGGADDEAKKKKEEEEAAAKAKTEKEGKADAADSIEAAVAAAIDKAFAGQGASLDAKIDAAVKKALGLDEKAGEKKTVTDAAKLPGSTGDEDASYLVKGIWGMR